MHSYFVSCFLGSKGNGYSRMIAPPMLVTDSMWLQLDSATYKLGTLELVGIANHESPVVFVDLLHRVSSIRRETRSLTPAEERALDTLRAGKDVVVETSRNRRNVLGALRAQTLCLGCHKGAKVGDLLGAFSYRLDSAKLPASLILH